MIQPLGTNLVAFNVGKNLYKIFTKVDLIRLNCCKNRVYSNFTLIKIMRFVKIGLIYKIIYKM